MRAHPDLAAMAHARVRTGLGGGAEERNLFCAGTFPAPPGARYGAHLLRLATDGMWHMTVPRGPHAQMPGLPGMSGPRGIRPAYPAMEYVL